MVKIAISIPEATLRAVEEARRNTGESRSEFLRRAAETMIRSALEDKWDAEYADAYRKMPETAEDHPFLSSSMEALGENPWEVEEAGVASGEG